MSIKGRIANFYSSKSKRVNFIWILAQIAGILFVGCSLGALFVTPAKGALSIGMKVYDIFVICLVLFLMIFKIIKKSMINTNELYIGYYIGCCMMTCMNLIIISVMYGSQSNLVEIVGGSYAGVVLFRLVASFAIILIFFYLTFAFLYIRYYSDILTENRGHKVPVDILKPVVVENQAQAQAQASQEMVLFKKTTPTAEVSPANASNAMVLANKPANAPAGNAMVLAGKPANAPADNAMVLANKSQTKKEDNTSPLQPSGMMAPPGLA